MTKKQDEKEEDDVLTARTTKFDPLNEFVLEISTKIPEIVVLLEKSKKSKKSLVAHFHSFLDISKVTACPSTYFNTHLCSC